MAYRPAQIYTGTGWDDIGDPRVGTVQSDVTALQAGKIDYATPKNNQNGSGASAYTFVLADATRLTVATNAAAKTFTIPPQTAVTWPNDTIIRVLNTGAGALTIAGGLGVTVTNAAKTLLQYESAALVRTGSNAWTLAPFGGTPDLETAANRNFKAFTSSGSTTVPPWAKKMYYLIVRGGNNGGTGAGAAGGAGGQVLQGDTVVTGGTSITVTVGGAASNSSVAISGGSTFTANTTGAAGGASRGTSGSGNSGADGTAPSGVFAGPRLAGGGGGSANFNGSGGRGGQGDAGSGGGTDPFFGARVGGVNSGGGGGGAEGGAGGGASGGSGLVKLYFS
jgi:hypothetical protein